MHHSTSARLYRPTLSTTSLSLLTALFILLVDNRLFWRSFTSRLGLDSIEHWGFVLTVAAVFLLLNLFIALFAFRPIFKPFLVILLLTMAAISYFSDSYGVIIDKAMIDNLLETDINEASELLTWPLIHHLLLFGALPAALVVLTRIRGCSRRGEWLMRSGVVLGSLVLLLGIGLAQYKEFVLCCCFPRAGHPEGKRNITAALDSMGSAMRCAWKELLNYGFFHRHPRQG